MINVLGSVAFVVTNAAAGLLIARYLGPAGRGEVSYAFLLMSIGAALGGFGYEYAATHLFAPTRNVARQTLWRLWALTAGSSLIATGTLVTAALVIRPPLSPAVVVMGTLGFTLASVNRAATFAQGKVHLIGVVRLAVGVAYLVGVAILLLNDVGASSVIWAWAAVWVVSALCFGSSVWRATVVGSNPEDTARLTSLHRAGLESWHSSLAQIVTYRMDQVVILLALGAVALGQYALAVFVMSVLLLVADGTVELEFPASIRLEPAERYARARHALFWVSGLVAGLGLICVLLAPFVVRPLVGPGFSEVPVLMLLLYPGVVAASAWKVATAALYGGQQTKVVRRIALRTAALVAVATVPVVVTFGTRGAAALSSIVYVILSLQYWRALTALSPAVALRDDRETAADGT